MVLTLRRERSTDTGMAPPKQGTPLLIRVPQPVVDALDETVTAAGYRSRAELIRLILGEWVLRQDRR